MLEELLNNQESDLHNIYWIGLKIYLLELKSIVVFVVMSVYVKQTFILSCQTIFIPA
jgi:hypothetical protein